MSSEKKMSNNTKAPTVDPRGRCGTSAGYQAHRRRGERACAECRHAHSVANVSRKKGKSVRSPAAKPRKRNVPFEQQGDTPIVSTPKVAPTPAKRDTPKVAPTPAKRDTPKREIKATPTHVVKVPDGVPTPPDWLKRRGLDLWIEVNQNHTLNASALSLLAEACRTVDRLERIAGALSSRSTLWFELGDVDQATELGIPIVVNGMIGEARQLQTTLRQTLNTLGVISVGTAQDAAMSPLDQLAERRKRRLEAQRGKAQ